MIETALQVSVMSTVIAVGSWLYKGKLMLVRGLFITPQLRTEVKAVHPTGRPAS
jgi:hypothetical protein